MMEQTVVNRRYRVDRPVGAGGMAVVYRGHDLLLGRDVAIKILRPQFAADPSFRARFEREAEAAAGFAHPNIVDIYDVGEEHATPYIVMAFVDGLTLKAIIEREGPFHPDDVAALLLQVGAALDYAHERGYVHRDVKPQNVLVDAAGVARVVDFGIAKGLADADLTEVGVGLGTVHYLSPEQASGLMATPASDVYSVGVVAFEMLTGRLPFAGDSPIGVALRHVHDAPPRPSSFDRSIPPAVDAIVLRALDKNPTRRFPSAGALAAGMAEWRDTPAGGVPEEPAAVAAFSPSLSRSRSALTAKPAPTTAVPIATLVVAPPPAGQVRSTGAPSTARSAGRSTTGDDLGCATWLVGAAILIGLVGLIWFGFRLTPRLADVGGGAVAPTMLAPPATTTAGSAPGGSGEPPSVARTGSRANDSTPASTLVTVPDLAELPIEAGTDVLNGVGLRLAEAEPVFSDGVPAGAIARQAPPPGAVVAQGETVSVSPSQGSARIDLAALDLAGRPADEAEALLRREGLEVTREDVPAADVPAGRLVATDPPNRAAVGETVTIRVSAGDVVRIPGAIQGQPVEQAAVQLEALGLRVRERFAVGQATIDASGLDLATTRIVDGDVVGIQGEGVNFEALVPTGTEVDLVYYDAGQEGP